MTLAIKPPVWVDGGRADSRYNNTEAATPFGPMLITWKGWKSYPNYCLDECPFVADGTSLNSSTLEDAKQEAEALYSAELFRRWGEAVEEKVQA